MFEDNCARSYCETRIWNGLMNRITVIFVFCLSAASVNAQKVFSVDYESRADVKVFVVDYESRADLLVYKRKLACLLRTSLETKRFSIVVDETTGNKRRLLCLYKQRHS